MQSQESPLDLILGDTHKMALSAGWGGEVGSSKEERFASDLVNGTKLEK